VASAKLSQLRDVPIIAKNDSKRKSVPKVQGYRQNFINNLA